MNTDNKGQQNQNQGGGQRMSGNGSQEDSQDMRKRNQQGENQQGENPQGGNQNQNSNRGNFANDPERAREAGRKGGQS